MLSDDGGGEAEAEDLLPEGRQGRGILVVTRGPGAGSRLTLSSPVISIGRHATSDVFLDDISVSRRHAEIERRGTQYEIRDLGSLNGTYVNGQRFETAALRHGDELRIGRFKLQFLGP